MKDVNDIKNKIKASVFAVIISLGLCIGANAATTTKTAPKVPVKAPVVQKSTVKAAPKAVTLPKTPEVVYEPVSSLAVAANPEKYLNKRIKIKAKFDKFSMLGLDYKPAYKSSEKYITFLIKRDDVKDHTVPLSEMKNFLPRDIAERYIDLKPGDEVEYSGTVFSAALGDTWINVEKFNVLSPNFKEKTPVKK